MSFFTFLSGIASWIAAASGLAPVDQAQPRVSRVVIEDTIILRVPVRPMRRMPAIEWNEKKGPKCLSAKAIAGAALSGPSSIDFLMKDRRRVRAHLDDNCPALDFYGGFYLNADDDEQVCARRHEVRSRVGGSCRIARFRSLVPEVKR